MEASILEGKDALVSASFDKYEYLQGYVQSLIDTLDEITMGAFSQ